MEKGLNVSKEKCVSLSAMLDGLRNVSHEEPDVLDEIFRGLSLAAPDNNTKLKDKKNNK